MAKNKPVYAFEEADSKKRMLLGGKGAGLSEMTRLKLPVPPGFTIQRKFVTSITITMENFQKMSCQQ